MNEDRMDEVLLDSQSVHKSFGRTEALRGASLSVAAGEVVAVTGPSGSGKSTLLLCAAGVLRPESGRVTYAGQDLDELGEAERSRLRRRDFGLVLQFGQLVPEMSAVQNVALPLLLDRHDKASSFTAARGWLERLDALDLADARPGEMSGGESQRIAIARALVSGPRVIFADEPTGALDTVNSERVLQVLLEVSRETSASLVLVTHDNRVAAVADREVILRDGSNELRVGA
ncbi:ABC transporter ATP-binding protein [Jatrophihabitans sp.]|uniref:ABC transporter ATP-binding protein n=1 Tax=Jatrophihabitans sp. TaxID=1932789 RepID=UPI0030C67AA2|nr:Macrolide transporter ATP-binding protein [Jatrophihabitans sp.]